MSHPSWVCGLKLVTGRNPAYIPLVTPFVGVWIETNFRAQFEETFGCHTLRGCVD